MMKAVPKILLTFLVLSAAMQSGAAAAADSPLLLLEVPGEGLLQEAEAFARVGGDAWHSSSGLSFAESVDRAWQTLSASGKRLRVFYFFCTVYYTPRESGFIGGGGFDMSPDSRGAFGGRRYPASFLKSVTMEGFGRIKEPVNGNSYMKYDGSWGYARVPLGNRNNALVSRLSAAVHRRNSLFGSGTRFLILDPEIYNALGSLEWEAADTGGGLFHSQIDLYWGEDDPLGPWPRTAMAASCPIAVQWIVPVVIAR